MNSVNLNWLKRKLNKFEIPDGLDEVERSVCLLKKTNSVQRISVLINLPSIIRDHPEAQDVLLPKIFKDVLSWDEVMQVEWGASLAVIIEENLLNEEMNNKLYLFILEALESWNKAKWDIVCEMYINHLDNVTDDEEEQKGILDKLLVLWLSLWELSQAIPSRWMGARLMAILSNLIDKEKGKKKWLSKMKMLCRDFNWEVRKAIATHLQKIFNLLDREETDTHMLDIMVELIDDEEQEVKNLAIEAFLTNIDHFTDEKIEDSCLEIVVDIVKNEANKELLLEKLDFFLENSETLWKHFSAKEYIEWGDDQLTKKILSNTHIIEGKVGEKYFIENIYEPYIRLIKDEDESIRTNIAKNIHWIISDLDTISWYDNNFEKYVTTLMLDKSAAVWGSLLVYLDKIVKVLVPQEITEEMTDQGIDKKISTFKSTVAKNFAKMEEVVKTNWRYLNWWIDCWYKLIDIFEPINVAKKFLPQIMTHLKKGSKETRRSWIQFMWLILSEYSDPSFIREVWDLASSLPYSTCSFTRVVYLELINELVNAVSK